MTQPRLVLRRLCPCRVAAFPQSTAKRTNTITTTGPLRRGFAQNAAGGSRPQLPYLSTPAPRGQFRYLTTERRRWLAHEALLTARYVAIGMGMVLCGYAAAFALREESRERAHPTPHEWSFKTRLFVRQALADRARTDVVEPDWCAVYQNMGRAVARLEDPARDGAGVCELSSSSSSSSEGDDPPRHPPGSKDVSVKSEEWRRGYHGALMGQAKAAEHVDGWMLDRTRRVACPPEMVRGPSNPRPQPLPARARGAAPAEWMQAPREEDCEPAFPTTADDLYLRLLGTKGFSPRQRMDAALAYASWLEFKGVAGPALILYEDAVRIAAYGVEEGAPPPPTPQLLDEKTWTLRDPPVIPTSTTAAAAQQHHRPSANLLTSLTAYASFRARRGDVASALPIMISILRARRALPSGGGGGGSTTHDAAAAAPAPTQQRRQDATAAEPPLVERIANVILSFVGPPAYPAPSDDGALPPSRSDPAQLCEEAALHSHIGEMLFASSSSSSSPTAGGGREDGLAWTREAVDMAEEQLRRLDEGRRVRGKQGGGDALAAFGMGGMDGGDYRTARSRCRECLAAGLGNWEAMVSRLAREEEKREEEERKRRREDKNGGGGTNGGGGGGGGVWFGLRLWGDSKPDGSALPGRWAAEEKVVAERKRRARPLLEETEVPTAGIMSLVWA